MSRRSIKQPGMNAVVVSGTAEVVAVTGNLCDTGLIRRVVSETCDDGLADGVVLPTKAVLFLLAAIRGVVAEIDDVNRPAVVLRDVLFVVLVGFVEEAAVEEATVELCCVVSVVGVVRAVVNFVCARISTFSPSPKRFLSPFSAAACAISFWRLGSGVE